MLGPMAQLSAPSTSIGTATFCTEATRVVAHLVPRVAKWQAIRYAACMAASILDQIREYPTRRFEPGEIIVEQGTTTGKLFFLIEGTVEVVKDDVRICVAREPGA